MPTAAGRVGRRPLSSLTNLASAAKRPTLKSRILQVTSKTRLIAKTKKVVVKKNCLKELAKDVLMEHVPVTVVMEVREVQVEVREVQVEVREVQEVDLPEGVEDLDAGDDVQGCSEYAAHIYSHLRQLEAKYSLGRDPLASSTITPKMRAVLFDWMTQVQQEFKLVQETLFLSFSIVDRFLAVSGRHVFRSQLQLLGVTAMFVAAKIEEIYAPELNDFVYITDHTYTSEEIRHMEVRLLAGLDWDFSAPRPLNFLRRYSRAGRASGLVHAAAKFLLELGVQDYRLVACPPSLQAAAALHLSLRLLGGGEGWSTSLLHYSGYSSAQLLPTSSLLHSTLAAAPQAKLQAVRTKYRDPRLLRVSALPQLCPQLS